VQDFRDLVRYVMAHPFLTSVRVEGPFPDGTSGPEFPAVSKETWPAVPVTGRIALPASKQGPGVAFVVSKLSVPAPLATELLLGAGDPVQVWLNGVEIYKGKPAAGPDQARVAVKLDKGENELRFRVSYQGDAKFLYARVLDPQRKLTQKEADSTKRIAEP
jgi:hypothetical protein